MTDRKAEIFKLIPDDCKNLLTSVIDETVFLEKKLDNLRNLPFIEINRTNPMQQRSTPAAKLYKEAMQQYLNCVKLIESAIYRDKKLDGSEEEVSPFREWLNAHSKKSSLEPR